MKSNVLRRAKRREEWGMPYPVKMVEKELRFVRYKKLVDPDADHNLMHATDFSSILCAYERLFMEDKEADVDYKTYLLNYIAEQKRVESNKKQREIDEECDNDSYHEEENDPQYELFLKSLKEHEKSYILEGEENGLPVLIKYEGDSTLDKECDLEPIRKLRSDTKQKDGPSDQMRGVENQRKHKKEKKLTCSKKLTNKNKSKSEKEKNVKLSANKFVWDPDYLIYMRSSKVVDDHYVYKYGGHRVVSELKNGKNNHEKEEYNDGSFLHMKILDSDTFYKEGNPNFTTVALKDEEKNYEKEYNDRSFSDVEILESAFDKQEISVMNKGSTMDLKDIAIFRQKVITVLSKPYNDQEYDRLCHDIEIRRPEERHLDLRNGRERSYSIEKVGKSYLDHYPGLERKLLLVEDDKPKCLNLLRGFFFWLQQPEPPFCPWEDAECLAITPASAKTSYRGFSQ